MMLMGDEYGASRQGNNNWYGHDQRFTWFRWDEMEEARQTGYWRRGKTRAHILFFFFLFPLLLLPSASAACRTGLLPRALPEGGYTLGSMFPLSAEAGLCPS